MTTQARTPISMLGLTRRTARAVASARIRYVEELSLMSDEVLAQRFGRNKKGSRTVQEIKIKLNAFYDATSAIESAPPPETMSEPMLEPDATVQTVAAPKRATDGTPPIISEDVLNTINTDRLHSSIRDIGLPRSFLELLLDEGYDTVESLARTSEGRIQEIEGLGKQACRKVADLLELHLFTLSDKPPLKQFAQHKTDDPITVLNLSEAGIATLIDGGIHKVDQLMNATTAELLAVKGVGRQQLRKIIAALVVYFETQAVVSVIPKPQLVADQVDQASNNASISPVVQELDFVKSDIVQSTTRLPQDELTFEEKLNRPISDLKQLTNSICFALSYNGFKTVQQVVEATPAQLESIRGIDWSAIKKIRRSLRVYLNMNWDDARHNVRLIESEQDANEDTAEVSHLNTESFDDMLDRPIADLNLSRRVYTSLDRNNWKTIRQLVLATPVEIYAIKGIGGKSVDVIGDALLDYLGCSWEVAQNRLNPQPLPSSPRQTIALDARLHLSLETADRISIQRLGLSLRVERALHRHGIKSVGELLRTNANEIHYARNIGDTSITEIEATIQTLFGTDWSTIRQTMPELESTPLDSVFEPDIVEELGRPKEHVPEVDEDPIFSWEGVSLESIAYDWLEGIHRADGAAIIVQRNGLFDVAERTLNHIAEERGLSRERVRQIERDAKQHLISRNAWRIIAPVADLVLEALEQHDGVINSDSWKAWLSQNQIEVGKVDAYALLKLLANFEETDFVYDKTVDCILFEENVANLSAIIKGLDKFLFKHYAPIAIEHLITQFQQSVDKQPSTKLIKTCVHAHPHIEMLGEYVVIHKRWGKRKTDVIVTALRLLGRPAYYTDIGVKTNSLLPPKKRTPSRSIPGVCDRKPELFVPMPGKYYGLVEWELDAEDTPARVAHRVLREFGERLTLSQITQIVREKHSWSSAEIIEAIQQDTRFIACGDNIYSLVGIETGRYYAATVEHTSSYSEQMQQIEDDLRQRLQGVNLFGQINTNRDEFDTWCQLVREEAIEDGKVYPQRIPPALFLATLVFTARYADAIDKEFWKPYANFVWQLPYHQTYYQRWSERFKECRTVIGNALGIRFLEDQFFAIVRSVYRHAIIPAFLEKEFADWLKQHWEQIIELDPDLLAVQLQQDASVQRLSPMLQTFLTSVETKETAIELITNMATATGLFVEGESAENISDLLNNNPIERGLWRELAASFVKKTSTQRKSTQRVSTRWIWSHEEASIQLAITNTTISTDSAPSKAIWVPEGDTVADADTMIYLEPWETEDGAWWIEEEVISDIAGTGTVFFVDENDGILAQKTVSALPDTPALFFRPTATGETSVFVDYQARPMRDGEWWVCLRQDVQLIDAKSKICQPFETNIVPNPLQYATAGAYQLTMPVQIRRNNRRVGEIESKVIQTIRPKLLGHNHNRIADLAPTSHVIFTTPVIWLELADTPVRSIENATLWIRSGEKQVQQSLKELHEKGAVEVGEQGAPRILLQSLLKVEAGSYELQLRQDLQPLLDEPLRFAVIPDLKVQPPDPNIIYGPDNLPTCILYGLDSSQIVSAEHKLKTEPVDTGVQITWLDLRGVCRVQIKLNRQIVSMTWALKRIFSWVEPADVNNETISQAKLHVIAPTERDVSEHQAISYFYTFLKQDDDWHRYNMPKRGHKTISFATDNLRDMIEAHDGSQVNVMLRMRKREWTALTLVRRPIVRHPRIEYEVNDDESHLIFGCDLEATQPGTFRFLLYNLESPQDQPLELAVTDALSDIHIFPVRLDTGRYWFEILFNDNVLPLNLQPLTIDLPPLHLSSPDLGKLMVVVRSSNVGQVSAGYARDFLHLISVEISSQLTPNRLFQLATLPPTILQDKRIRAETLDNLWQTLARLKHIHDVERWEDQHGLLPAWATVNQVIRLELLPFGDNRIKVWAERLSRRGNRGIGSTYLKLQSDDRKERVYVRWEVAQSGKIQAHLALPAEPTNEPFADADILDMYPVYQCTRCRRLVGKRGFINGRDDPLCREHWHHRDERFVELLHDTIYEAIPVQPAAHYRWQAIRYFDEPESIVDKQYLRDGITKPLVANSSTSPSPITKDAYQQAVILWSQRYHTDANAHESTQKIVKQSQWRRGLDTFATMIAKGDLEYRECAPTARLLKALQIEEGQQLVELDTQVVLLTLLLRLKAYYPRRATKLQEQLALSDRDLADILFSAETACPELLKWAFTWIELFHIHSIS